MANPKQPAAKTAILDAATALFSERSPSSVSLREIARVAGVNYGLIHHYFGTKEAILAEVFARFSQRGAEQIAQITDIDEAVRTFTPAHGAGPQTHMLAWAILDGATADQFRQSPAIERIRVLIEEEWAAEGRDGEAPFDSRVVAATVIGLLHGWRFFEPFLRSGSGLADLERDTIMEEVIELTLAMVRAAAP